MTEDNLRREREITHEIAHLTIKLHKLFEEETKRFKETVKKSSDIINCILLRQEELNSIERLEEKIRKINGKE